MKKALYLVVILVVLIAGYYILKSNQTNSHQSAFTNAQLLDIPKGFTETELLNATYTLIGWKNQQAVTFVNGKFGHENVTDSDYAEIIRIFSGDVDGDGLQDALLYTREHTGGSGSLHSIAIISKAGGKVHQVGLIGIPSDRVNDVENVKVANGNVTLRYTTPDYKNPSSVRDESHEAVFSYTKGQLELELISQIPKP